MQQKSLLNWSNWRIRRNAIDSKDGRIVSVTEAGIEVAAGLRIDPHVDHVRPGSRPAGHAVAHLMPAPHTGTDPDHRTDGSVAVAAHVAPVAVPGAVGDDRPDPRITVDPDESPLPRTRRRGTSQRKRRWHSLKSQQLQPQSCPFQMRDQAQH